MRSALIVVAGGLLALASPARAQSTSLPVAPGAMPASVAVFTTGGANVLTVGVPLSGAPVRILSNRPIAMGPSAPAAGSFARLTPALEQTPRIAAATSRNAWATTSPETKEQSPIMADKPYEYQEFPKHLFHQSHTAEQPNVRTVQTREEQDALGGAWSEAPPAVPTAQVDLAAENAELRKQLAELQAGSSKKK